MAKLTEEKVSGSVVYAGKFLELHKDTVRLPDGTQTAREYVRHPGAVAVVALTGEGAVILERQHRYPLGRDFIEIPAGKIDPGEERLACAKRELLEETGYAAADWQRIGLIHNAIGYSDESIEIWLAKGLEKREAKLDAGEFLEVFSLPFEQAIAKIRSGEITDAKTITALLWVNAFMR